MRLADFIDTIEDERDAAERRPFARRDGGATWMRHDGASGGAFCGAASGPVGGPDEPDHDGEDGDSDVGVVVKSKPKTKRPSMYKVLLLNDDYTPMEFVVHVLERFFGISHERAVQLMLTVHNEGVAVVGVFTYEVAETKVTQVMDYARQHQHPLQCAMEKE